MTDEGNFNGGLLNKNNLEVRDLIILTRGMQDSFKIDGGVQNEKKTQKITGNRCYAKKCSANQVGSG